MKRDLASEVPAQRPLQGPIVSLLDALLPHRFLIPVFLIVQGLGWTHLVFKIIAVRSSWVEPSTLTAHAYSPDAWKTRPLSEYAVV
jgi:hypothetical protein